MAQVSSPVTAKLFEELAPQTSAPEPRKQLGKEDFLKLLTLQLRSQNPLNPTSNQEMVAQLAQFSALEQMQNISATLEQLLQSNSSLALSIAQYSAPSLIGRSAVATSSQLRFDGTTPVEVHYQLASAAQEVVVEIQSDSGAVVRRLRVPAEAMAAGEHTLTWDGRDERGNAVPAGTYAVVIRATDSAGKEVAATTQLRGQITGIRYTQSGLMVLIGDVEVPIANIIELR